MMIASLIGFIGGSSNFFLDFNLNIYPLGNYFVFLYALIMTYAIIKHRLFEIRVIITRSLVYGILLTLVTLSFVFTAFLSGQLFGGTTISRAIVSFIVAALIVFGLDPLKRVLSLATDKVFFKAKIDYQETLRKLSEIVNTELDLSILTERLETTLTQELKLKSSAILLRETYKGKGEKFEARMHKNDAGEPVALQAESPLIEYIQEKKHVSLLESLERKIEDMSEGAERQKLEASRAEIEQVRAALVAPVFAQDRLNAVMVLGPKLSGDSFSNEDLQLVEVLSPQLGSAIQKAKLFDEVRQFGEQLKVRVREATEELKEQNVSLITLQRITTDITRTLDFNKVVQDIADAVSSELGFVGSILIFLDEDGRTFRARAITNTPLTSKALKLLPVRFDRFATDMQDPKQHNLAVDVMKDGQIRYTEQFSDALSPPLPKAASVAIQKLLKIQTVILVPIVVENRVIGLIEVGARRKQEEIGEREIETLKSMADELGIVARNLRLFEQIRTTNEQLEVANKHLKQLDQAKSEFVSIASHQLRTPMTGIMGYLSMMVEGDFGRIEPKHLTILQSLLDESQRMIRLINLFLNVSKIEAGKLTFSKREMQLPDVIEREVRELGKIAKDKKLELTYKKSKAPLPPVFADADKIQDVLLNLIDNAIKYTKKGSVTVSATAEDGGVRVDVKDTGIGITKEDIRELFNKFVRAPGIAQIHPDGSGLGLFIAKSIVEGHAGKIWVESDGVGKGSTFSFWLPVGKQEMTTTEGKL